MILAGQKEAKTDYLLIVILLILSFSLRFYNIGKIPIGMAPDEIDQGYNAYSILRTGKDVYGYKFPLSFKSFDDYKLPIPVYLTIPSIIIFGNTNVAIRFIPALIGSITPLLFFLFIKLLYPEDKKLPFLGAFMIAISPWSIAISRGETGLIEFVAIILTFFIFFLLSISKNIKFVFPAALAAAISLYVYYASIIYIPIISVLLCILYKDKLLKNIKTVFIAAVLFAVIAMPAVFSYLFGNGQSRLNKISIFSRDITLPMSISEMQIDRANNFPFSNIFHNRRIIYSLTALDNYLDYFNLDYLFLNSWRIRYFYVTYIGLFYLIELPFFLYGLFLMIKRRGKSDFFLLWTLIISPIPAMITLGSPFPNRSLILLTCIQVISAFGLYKFIKSSILNEKYLSKIRARFLFVIYLLCFVFFTHQYFLHTSHEYTTELDNGSWFSTVEVAMPYILQNMDKYDKVVFTWSRLKLAPATYFYYYNRTDPSVLQDKAARWTNEPPSFTQIYNQWQNVEFRPINWESDQYLKNTLFIGYPEEFPNDVGNIVNKTYTPGGKIHFIMVAASST